jgi:hypothetical protein
MKNALRNREPRSDQTSQREDSQKASLRNKSMSAEKRAGDWMN